MAGDYSRPYPIYGGSCVDVTIPPILPLILAKGANRTIYVQRILVTPYVYDAINLTFVDSITGVPIGAIAVAVNPAQPGEGSNFLYLDFGPKGVPLTMGANLLLGDVPASTNLQARIHIESFQTGLGGTVGLTPRTSTAGYT